MYPSASQRIRTVLDSMTSYRNSPPEPPGKRCVRGCGANIRFNRSLDRLAGQTGTYKVACSMPKGNHLHGTPPYLYNPAAKEESSNVE